MRFKIGPHRLAQYDAFWDWYAQMRTPEYRAKCIELGCQFDNMWVDESARRTWKTGTWLVILLEFAARMAPVLGRGLSGLIAIPQKTKIGGVLVPNMKKIFRDAPKGFAYEYHTTGAGEHEHLYIPAWETRYTLVGLDKNPDALRGPFRDVVMFTEAAFAKELYSTYVSEVQLQMQGLKHAFSVFESSKPKIVDHDWNIHFKPDAQARGAFTSMVITDNTTLTPEDIEDEIRKSGGRDSAECKRELFNIVEPDPEAMVIPEFDELVHVVSPHDYPQPEFALGHVGLDPGEKDPFGQVGLYLDFLRQQIVIQWAYQKSNASTGEMVEVLKGFERKLWGTEHRMSSAEPLIRIANAALTPMGKVIEPPTKGMTWWSHAEQTFKPNPYSRVSDIRGALVTDLNRDYNLNVRPAEKEPGSAEADITHLRMLFAARHPDGRPKIVILDNGRTVPIIQQLRSGMYKVRDQVHRYDFLRTKLLGHLDCLAALKYVVRDVRWNYNPNPPAFRDLNAPGIFVPEHLRKAAHAVRIQPPRALDMGARVKLR